MDDTQNPFAVIDAPQPAAPDDDAPQPFFTVGPWKIVVLMVLSLGVYRVYWFYRQFRARQQNGEDSIPLARAIFNFFFAHRLFAAIAQWRPDDEAEPMFNLAPSNGNIASLYVATIVLDGIVTRYDGDAVWIQLLGLVTIAIHTGVLVTVQRQIQDRLVPRGVPANTEATPGFLLAVACFLALWLAFLAGEIPEA